MNGVQIAASVVGFIIGCAILPAVIVIYCAASKFKQDSGGQEWQNSRHLPNHWPW